MSNLPLIGWALDLVFKISLSVMFVPSWNWLAPKYFYFLPEVYQNIRFWECVGLFIILGILKSFSPFSSSNSNTNTNN